MAITLPIAYRHDDAVLRGELHAVDTAPRPGLLLLHGGAGLDDHAREQAGRFAEQGYAVLAGDLYGAGVAGDRERVMGLLSTFRDDPAMLAARVRAGLDVLASRAEVSEPLAAIGYCFGGLAALTLARSACPLRGFVSVHGSLTTTAPAQAVSGRILVAHGAADPHVPMADAVAFAAEMDAARADWQLNVYGGALHGFTHRHQPPGEVPGVGFQAEADARSFGDVLRFLAAI